MKHFKKLFLLLFLFFLSCDSAVNNCNDNKPFLPDNSGRVTIAQGVWGNVIFMQGDFMPGPGDCNPSAKMNLVERELYVYKPVSLDSLTFTRVNGHSFIKKINGTFLAVVKSDAQGFYQLPLPAGKYSIFSKEDSLFYGNGGDGQGIMMAFDVAENKVTRKDIRIDYLATY